MAPPPPPPPSLDLSTLPPVFVLAAHLDMDALHAAEDEVEAHQGRLTYDAAEAGLFVGAVERRRRAALELRQLGVVADETGGGGGDDTEAARKMRPLEDAGSVDVDAGAVLGAGDVVVLRLEWLRASIAAGTALPLEPYTVYRATRRAEREDAAPVRKSATPPPASSPQSAGAGILERARKELGPAHSQPAKAYASSTPTTTTTSRRRYGLKRSAGAHAGAPPPKLVQQTTEDFEDNGTGGALPEMPEWVQAGRTLACERATPARCANEAFVRELEAIRRARVLEGDEVGVRAYSTSIAAVAAYPRRVGSAREIAALPGCDVKIAALWGEFAAARRERGDVDANDDDGGEYVLAAARAAEADDRLRVLRLFHDIWGVGAHTARQFYARGWRDLDDLAEYFWEGLTRTQQIGLKFFDEFQRTMPREEVERIAGVIEEHARRVAKDPAGVRCVIVGGYRRGKTESGDVDVIVSHTEQSETLGVVSRIVESLCEAGWVTHELTVSLSGTRRGQATLPFRGGAGGGHGFDTLDKALLVWRELEFDGKELGKANPNVHRRVDIIVAPWSKVGCAVLGWSAGTTFERDLRRYARKKKGWKFDSSGIRDRATGLEVDLEGIGGKCETIEEAERKVFKGLGLVYREPWERCTR